jgi:hypothetical protein
MVKLNHFQHDSFFPISSMFSLVQSRDLDIAVIKKLSLFD